MDDDKSSRVDQSGMDNRVLDNSIIRELGRKGVTVRSLTSVTCSLEGGKHNLKEFRRPKANQH